MTESDSLGAVVGTMRHRTRYLLFGALILLAVFAVLVAWNWLRRGDRTAMLMSILIGGAAIPAFAMYLKTPRRVVVRERGIVIEPYVGETRRMSWSDIAIARFCEPTGGQRSRTLLVRGQAPPSILFGDVVYDDFRVLVDALHENLGDRFEEGGAPR
ncbi:hypothetical protein [Polyangium sp. 6x1]|uniref:hypothetical protein n=1 Tax=Polyangium sp. 6x1 TaxID=3042689 RepID=UPI002482F0F5|nr:hypothetical protein [Polyangium sp. 6x1]MDI1450992.1 hypothetical protein [Polyangium sp. 6x1]